jgi:hypothetical protein
MKKLLLTHIILFGIAALINAQTKLQYSVHAIHAGIDNPMTLCKYSNPGTAGANQKWDFSKLELVTPFTGFVAKSDFSQYNSFFPKANTVLTEFNSLFYLNVTESQTEQYGYISSDGKVKISYRTPFIKMKYPFGYGDIYSGTLSGTYKLVNISESDLAGDYTVEADAYGTLILPGNSVFNDVIRVKTYKEFTTKFPSGDQRVEIVTYRWYNAIHRYPLLVLTEYTTTFGQNKYSDYQAAYNAEALKTPNTASTSDVNINLFPNPVTTVLHLTFNTPTIGQAEFSFYDAAGRNVLSISKEIVSEGVQEFDLSEYVSGFKSGKYILMINISGVTYQKEFVKSIN